MEIDSNSWHARVYQKYGKNDQPNLCQYFWRVILGAPLAWAFSFNYSTYRPFINLFLLLILLCTLVAAVVSGMAWWYGPLMVFGGTALFGGFLGLVVLSQEIEWRLKERRDPRIPEKKKDSLLKSYIFAKKNKVCPYIEFTEE